MLSLLTIASRILPTGQYTHTLRLKSKLFDLQVEYANLSCFARQGRGLQCFANKKRSTTRADHASRILPTGQYTRTLRLKSKLFDLRVEYANLSCFARQGRGLQCFANKKRSTTRADLFLLVEHQGLEPWTDRL